MRFPATDLKSKGLRDGSLYTMVICQIDSGNAETSTLFQLGHGD